MRTLVSLAVLVLFAMPARAAVPTGDLSTDMWTRLRTVEPAKVDLKLTPTERAPETLTLQQCVSLVRARNADFRQSQANLVNARRNLWAAEQQLYHTASADAQREKAAGEDSASNSYSADWDTTWKARDGGALSANLSTGTQDVFGNIFSQQPSWSLSYSRPLLQGAGLASSTAEQLRSARVDLAAQEMTFYDAAQALTKTIISDYYEVLLAEGEVGIAQRSVDRAKKLYDVNYAKFTGEGLGAPENPDEVWVSQVAEIDVDQARLTWEQSKQQLISKEQSYRDTMDTLLLALGYQAGATPRLTTAIPFAPQTFDEQALVPVALANSTELARLALDREDAVAALRIARSDARPDLTASLGLSDLGETETGATSTGGWFTGLSLSVPLGLRSNALGVERASRALAVLEQQQIATRDSVAQGVQQQIRASASSKARLDIGELSTQLASKNRDAAQAMYEEGLVDILRVTDAENRLVEAESSLLQEKVTYFLSLVSVRRALGEDITQGLPE